MRAALAVIAVLLTPAAAGAATPASGALNPDANGAGSITWSGSVTNGTESAVSDDGAACFGADRKPDPASGCDAFALDVPVDATYYDNHPGAVNVTAGGFGLADLDLYVYRRNADGTRGDFVTGGGLIFGAEEAAAIDKAAGAYYVVLTPYTILAPTTYTARAELLTRQGPPIAELEKLAPKGLPNVRASHDQYTSHSEPTIAMDPLDHDHLLAGSKMYENNDKYLFKIGTYESFDGGRTWKDLGHLPGYCEAEGQCDPKDEARYRTTSDITIAFDDEGNAYANVLDAPGGTAAFVGFNMTVHIKKPGQPWSQPIVVHDNRRSELQRQSFLDDKNWIAVDNHTDTSGGPNAPRDGRIGTMYVCWSFDGTGSVPLQSIVVMRSLDGGRTWGGIRPGDNLPLPLSQKTLVSGIGCHLAIGPKGEVYATWYDNQLNAMMQVKSTNRGQSWTPAAPIARITGLNEAFTGEAFRNLSLPSTAVDNQGNVYVVAASLNAEGAPLLGDLFERGEEIKKEGLSAEGIQELLKTEDANNLSGKDYKAGGDGTGPLSGSDIVLFKSTNGGRSYTGPVRVNQDPVNGDADQFQPWIAVTPSGQVDISYFDRRDDPANYFINTYISQSEDGGRTFVDKRVSQRMWNPAINAPTSVSGAFIGDYQGLVADDDVAIPFWNDTQLATALPKTDKDYSPYQEVFSARVGDVVSGSSAAPTRCAAKTLHVGAKTLGKLRLSATRTQVGKAAGPPVRTARGVLRYCVTGGGSVVAAFGPTGRLALAATTARGHTRLGIGRGTSQSTLRRRFGRKLVAVGAGTGVYRLRAGKGVQTVFGVRARRVTFVALVSPSLAASPKALRTQLRRAALIR